MLQALVKALNLKRRLRAGEVVLGAQIALADPSVVEIMGHAGFDLLVIDTEHSAHSAETVKAMLQAAEATPAVALVRPSGLDDAEIRRILDLGSPGVLCPFIETAPQAMQLVSACRYPPAGHRGYGPRRASTYGHQAEHYFRNADKAMICIPIIESVRGVDNIAEIVAVDGIDGVSIGPMDLSLDMGIFQQFEHDLFHAAVERVRAASRISGKAVGTGCYSIAHARSCVSEGDTLLLVGGDDVALREHSVATIRSLRDGSGTEGATA